MPTKTYDRESRKRWYSESRNKPCTDQLKLGCLQRIADATEQMAHRYDELHREVDRQTRAAARWRGKAEQLERSNRALRAWITRFKRERRA